MSKELAIRTAELLKKNSWIDYFNRNKQMSDDAQSVKDFLDQSAWKILKMEGMREKIDEHLYDKLKKEDETYIDYGIRLWWSEDEAGRLSCLFEYASELEQQLTMCKGTLKEIKTLCETEIPKCRTYAEESGYNRVLHTLKNSEIEP